jgi:hypothetical protein
MGRRFDTAVRNIDAAAGVGDADIVNMFNKISREIDGQLWLVEAHLHDS